MAQFKIYAAELSRFGPVGVIIVTAFENAGGYPRAESFLLIPNSGGEMYSHKLSFDVKTFEDSPIELNEKLMLSEVLAQAKIDLGLYLEAKAKEEKSISLPDAPNVREDNSNLLVHVWLQNTCPHIHDVGRKTEYKPLKDHIGNIITLPNITNEEL